MSLIKNFFANTRKPGKGITGKITVQMMNILHNKNATWCLSNIEIEKASTILEIGCGGGKNISHLLKKAPQAKVYGVDYSKTSVESSRKFNRKAIVKGRVNIVHGTVSSLPFENEKFDLATAFETIYFWPDIINDFKEVKRVLKSSGKFFICNELSKREESEKWSKLIDMNVYSIEQLKNALIKAGFSDVVSHEHENGKWLCVIAQKS
jgi:ubiquinone/menaquinone biosynthesis C-methylase UbiE